MRRSIFALVFLAGFYAKCIAQESIVLYENGMKDIYGYTLYLDNFWLDNGKIKADIEIYKSPGGKPFSGGYGLGSEMDLTDSPEGGMLYLYELFKLGKDELGYVVLSREMPADTVVYYSDIYELTEGATRDIGNLALRVVSVQNKKALLDMRNVKFDSLLYSNRYEVNELDTLWMGRAAYSVDSISEASVFMTKINNYIQLDGDAIPGELINAPPGMNENNYEGFTFIKKMYYSNKKRDARGKLGIYLVKIVSGKVNGVETAHPVIEVEIISGQKVTMPFTVTKAFEDEEEALEYAKEHGITHIDLTLKDN